MSEASQINRVTMFINCPLNEKYRSLKVRFNVDNKRIILNERRNLRSFLEGFYKAYVQKLLSSVYLFELLSV